MPDDTAFREALDALELQAVSLDRDGEWYRGKEKPAAFADYRAARARVLALYAERDEALAYANELCRSAFQIASRQGRDTNWSGFANRLMEALAQQHRVMYPGVESLQGQAEPYRVPANAERQGEVYEVTSVNGVCEVVLYEGPFKPGDRVRVVKEGT